jgi:pSer/pThr/pTyr-binding forkhead associated (FHA) protein
LQSTIEPSRAGVAAPRFLVRSGHSLGLTFALGNSPTLIGSDPACGVWLQDSGIASQHAHAELVGGNWQLMARVPGTFYNGVPLAPGQAMALTEGTRIRIGAVDLVFTLKPLPKELRTEGARDRPSQLEERLSGTPARASTGQRAQLQAFQAVPAGPEHVTPAIAPENRARADERTAYAMPSIPPMAPPPAHVTPSIAPENRARADERTAYAMPRIPPMAPPPAQRVRLRVETGAERGALAVLETAILIGSGANSQLRLPDPAVAPVHVEVRLHGGTAWVRAFAPAFKNGVPLTGEYTPLGPGERLQLGVTSVVLEPTA